jgi:hypothetical protein
MTHLVFPLVCPVRAKRTRLSLIVHKIMTFRLKYSFLYSSHTMTPCSQSFYMSAINGSKNTSIPTLACLGPDMRVVNRRYFHLWHNHGGRLYMHIITSQVLCGFLIFLKGFIPSVLRPNLIFLGWLEKSSSWIRSKCFQCLPSAGCRIFPPLFCWTCQSKSWASLALENIRFERSMIGRYHITRARTFLSLDPWLSLSGGAVFVLFRPFLVLL